ncbi:MAG: DUF359 domain-containing protein [Candidatus Micrarchaeota archaeon]
MKITEDMRKKLKKPLGTLTTIHKIKNARWIRAKKIVSIGDITTLKLLKAGILPHLAIFDFRFMRKKLPDDKKKLLKNEFPDRKTMKNTPGTVSDYLIKNAKKILERGGAIRIIGEEDLTAIAFAKHLNKKYVLLYGQPKKGIVIANPRRFP